MRAPSPINGEIVFSLTEKKDRYGKTYLFGGVQLFGVVFFIRPDLETPGPNRRWNATIRPYVRREISDDEGVWHDDTEER